MIARVREPEAHLADRSLADPPRAGARSPDHAETTTPRRQSRRHPKQAPVGQHNLEHSDVTPRLVSRPTMGVQSMPIGRIKPNPRNTRTHYVKQIRQIKDSIVAFGFTNPLLMSEEGELIAGHGRFAAAEELGLATVPVIVVAGLSPAKRRALAISCIWAGNPGLDAVCNVAIACWQDRRGRC
jgi:hypothetical protein